MPFDADTDNDLIRSLQVRLQTVQAQTDRLTQKVADTREALCARERSDGSIVIDFDKLADRLGLEQCLVLRAAIDERWSISGEAGQKPRVRLKAAG